MGCGGGKQTEAVTATGDVKPKAPKGNEEEDQELREALKLLGDLPIFFTMPRSSLSLLASNMNRHVYSEAEEMPGTKAQHEKQGDDFRDVHYYLCVCVKGVGKVKSFEFKEDPGNEGGFKLGDCFEETKIMPGDCFGSVCYGSTVIQRVKAVEGKCTVLEIARREIIKLGIWQELQLPNRRGAKKSLAEAAPLANAKAASHGDPPKTEEYDFVKQAINDDPYLGGLATEGTVKSLFTSLKRIFVNPETKLHTKGDKQDRNLYIVFAGSVDVEGKLRGPGSCFGAKLLLYGGPADANAVAQEQCEIFVCDRTSFRRTMMEQTRSGFLEMSYQLDKVPVINQMLREEKIDLLMASDTLQCNKGDYVFKEGDPADDFYMLTSGDVELTTHNETQHASTKQGPSYFGEVALLRGTQRQLTAKVSSDTATIFSLGRIEFNILTGFIREQLLEQAKAIVGQISNTETEEAEDLTTRAGIKAEIKRIRSEGTAFYDKLEILGLLSTGGFGAVDLVKEKGTDNVFALKSMSMFFVDEEELVDTVIRQKEIQSQVGSTFVLDLYATYVDDKNIYYLMEYADGGSLSDYCQRLMEGAPERKHIAKFYGMCFISALQHLHMRRILCRDVNPAKMLLSKSGYGKLYDFGCAKFTSGITFTVVGAEVYWAPEMVNLTGHSKALDWWSFGITLVEMLTGRVPWDFMEELDDEKLMTAIKSKRLQTYTSSNPNVSADAADLVRKLCQDKDTDRLPMQADGVAKMKAHGFFKGGDWEALAAGNATSPIMVTAKDAITYELKKDTRPEADVVREAIRMKFEPFVENEF
jgi:CRP-like cAMP-binding protein